MAPLLARLEPTNFFFWSYWKEHIDANNPITLHSLKANIFREITQKSADIIERVIMNVNTRVAAIIQKRGE